MQNLASAPTRPTLTVCPPLPEGSPAEGVEAPGTAVPRRQDDLAEIGSTAAARARGRAALRALDRPVHPRLTLIEGGRPSPLAALRPHADPDPLEVGDSGPSTLCANLARCVVEILAGARSLDQIARWVTDAVYVHLLRRSVIAQRARVDTTDTALRPRVHIGDPLLSSPAKDVVEAVVMVHQPARSRAVAIRLERHRSRWRASAINVL